MKPLIFTSFNDDIDPKFFQYQQRVMEKFGLLDIYMPLHYKWHHSEMLHGDILNKFVNKAFYERGYDCILIMDIDCIPLFPEAIEVTFDLASQGNLVGNAQRSNHIDNNKHIYAASSYIAFSEKTYANLGRPNFLPNSDGDTCEQLTFNAERMNVPLHLFYPSKIDSPISEKGEYWNLSDDGKKYGIGTEFGMYYDEPLSLNYHLFGSRLKKFDHLFFKKCEEILNDNGSIHDLQE